MRNSKKTIRLAILLMVACSMNAGAQISGESKSALTVEALLTLENALAMDKAAVRAKDLGLVKEPPALASKSVAPAVVPPASLSVSKIIGVGTDVKASLTYNGIALDGVRAGAKVGPCVVQVIENACVVLQKASNEPILKQVKKASNHQASREPEQCPRACWTGVALEGGFQPPLVGPPGAPPLPPGMPVGAVSPGQRVTGMVGSQGMSGVPPDAIAGRVQQPPNSMQFTGTPNAAQVRPGSAAVQPPAATLPVGQRTN